MNQELSSNEFRRKLFERINGLSTVFKVNYSINPNLKYEYPDLNPVILENIVNALISSPRFYTQTLHLMNKMNLPCPLVNYVRTPRPAGFQTINTDWCTQTSQTLVDNEQLDMSTSESEMEIDTTSPAQINSSQSVKNESKLKKLKVKSFLNKQATVVAHKNVPIEQVFEQITTHESTGRKFQSKPKQSDDLSTNMVILQSEFEGFAKMAPLSKSSEGSTVQLLPTSIESDSLDINDQNQFIKQSDLEKNRMNLAELKELPVFKNYEKGETNSRLYIKNVSKKAQESDLKFIFGRYIDWNDESHKNAFDIRLMKEGKMKGQAFITMPNEQLAEKALNDTNGYLLLGDKPLVVQFARSSKPK
jgi:U11/U12 small nuclear ribonucleoprotein SNRNP65